MVETSPLEIEIRQRIARDGPISVAEYMALCLMHPNYGYYATHDPLGKSGDFITAPEISQMFGELIGLWAVAVWQMMGAPAALNLVELGPGRGTMMADILRATKIVPAFGNAIRVHLVENSPALRARQRDTLANQDKPIAWHDSLSEVPHAPAIYLANEFFDALPVQQFVRQPNGWHERMVAVGNGGRLEFAVAERRWNGPLPMDTYDAPNGAIFEERAPNHALELAKRVMQHGAALVIDYGHLHRAVGDTLQAVRGHSYADPLVVPGQADLSAHVDFQALAGIAGSRGARAHGPIEQAKFLHRLGIVERAAALKAKANAAQVPTIDAALARLTDESPKGMGRMFKVLGLASRELGALPGFDD
jgi:NADH dehydrogenase [ubiquinone] 1 alpha subcomplex assembly factor 7